MKKIEFLPPTQNVELNSVLPGKGTVLKVIPANELRPTTTVILDDGKKEPKTHGGWLFDYRTPSPSGR